MAPTNPRMHAMMVYNHKISALTPNDGLNFSYWCIAHPSATNHKNAITLHADRISPSMLRYSGYTPLHAEVEVCSKPPQQRGSSSGNMCNMAEESEEAEQAGSVEQAAAPAPKPARRHSHVNKPSAPQRGRRRLSTAPCAQIGK